MMDVCRGGRRDGRFRWESWELAGMTLLLFSFNSSFAHHIFKCKQKQFVLSVFPLHPPLFLPQPLNHSPAGPSFALFVSKCLFAWLCLCMLCMYTCVCGARKHTHAHTHARRSLRTLTNSQWKSVASLSVRTSGSGHFAVSSRCTLT